MEALQRAKPDSHIVADLEVVEGLTHFLDDIDHRRMSVILVWEVVMA